MPHYFPNTINHHFSTVFSLLSTHHLFYYLNLNFIISFISFISSPVPLSYFYQLYLLYFLVHTSTSLIIPLFILPHQCHLPLLINFAHSPLQNSFRTCTLSYPLWFFLSLSIQMPKLILQRSHQITQNLSHCKLHR
ncbi:hypothetical protein CLIB1423_27S00760 [[Candida] railenensis]|uniref:Uncharacterized protein n=1 Tax=[Candida] railenensis TaxID=45579 RepID=A0A9P0W0Y8_9ASCO|nr:hypothetical protein CLIB1423_27S00760 [[Candida] railenensis]